MRTVLARSLMIVVLASLACVGPMVGVRPVHAQTVTSSGPVNLVQNGSFEQPAFTDNLAHFVPNATDGSEPGWSVCADVAQLGVTQMEVGNGWLGTPAAQGSQYTELNSNGPIGICQTISTVVGQTYQLHFWFAPRPNTPLVANQMNVSWGGANLTPTPIQADGTLEQTTALQWTEYTYTVTATSGMTQIQFTDVGSPDYTNNSANPCRCGDLLDNVQVYAATPSYSPASLGASTTSSSDTTSIATDSSWTVDGGTAQAADMSTCASPAWTTLAGASWIWAGGCAGDISKPHSFTKVFNLKAVPTAATLQVAVDNYATVVVNGNQVFSQSAQSNSGFFDSVTSYDVTKALQTGQNTITITAADYTANAPNCTSPSCNPVGVAANLTLQSTPLYTNQGTSANPLTLYGTTDAGDTVNLFESNSCVGTSLGSATASASGNWSITLPNALASSDVAGGMHTYTVQASGANYSLSSCSAPLTLTVDRTSPTSSITYPAVYSDSDKASYLAGCAPVGVCGTASDPADPTTSVSSGVAAVFVSIYSLVSNKYFDGHGFNSATGVWLSARVTPSSTGGQANWNLALPQNADGSLPLGDGQYIAMSAAVDNAGNAEAQLADTMTNCGAGSGGLTFSAGGGLTFSAGGSGTSNTTCPASGGLTLSAGGGLTLSAGGGLTFSAGGGLTFSAGGSGSCNAETFQIDTNPPQGSVTVNGQTMSGAVNIDPASTVHIQFGEVMQQSTVSASSIVLSAGTPPTATGITPQCTASPTATASQCEVVNLSGLQPSTVYTLTINPSTAASPVTDLAGNPAVTTTFTFTTAASSPLTGTAAQDTDGDGIPNGWDGTTFTVGTTTINTGAWGFNQNHHDVCVVENYMAGTGSDGNYHDMHISQQANQDIVNAFANAPVTNPDGTTGIHLVIWEGPNYSAGLPAGYSGPYYGGQIPMTDPLGVIDQAGFEFGSLYPGTTQTYDSIRNQYFVPTGISQFCHYSIIARNIGNTRVSGSSRDIPSSDSVIALGTTSSGVGSLLEQQGTVMHELGHNLGLFHGGIDDINYKPNYLSVMNYSFQFSGVPGGTAPYGLDYSRSALPDLPKSMLNDSVGLGSGASGFGTVFFCPSLASPGTFVSQSVANAAGPINWGCNSSGPVSGTTSADINGDLDTAETLAGYNDWLNLRYTGGVIGEGASPPPPDITQVDVNPSASGGLDSASSIEPKAIVPFKFTGWLAPINSDTTGTVINTGKAGKTYPVKFQLQDSSNNYIGWLNAVTSITYSTMNCATGTSDAIDYSTTSTAGLHYDSTANQFVYNWQTPSAPNCYLLKVALSDGSTRYAQFKLS
ncbi:MAG TPA: PxKF domain-containing protein [Chloroflexota bacterium]|nr:PxKF domain-containing protein [Chloroflexota bacterium]